jgi:hypothetical protein
MDIKTKKIISFSILIYALILSWLISKTCSAQDDTQLSITDISYYCYKSETHPSKFYYYIHVTISNSQDIQSLPIKVMIIEDDHTICPAEFRNISLAAHESQIFTFDWCTSHNTKSIEIAFRPSDPDLITPYNSGRRTVIITSDSPKNKNTPGPGASITIFLFICFIILLKRQNNSRHIR